jgi:hypothetical protein
MSEKIVYVRAQKQPGSVGWLIVWVFLCFPVAIIYYFVRSWGEEAKRYKRAK